ncbi:hypothetical protein GCM10009827_077260 [Dactylosporangium maewongense]|uniref:Uncharacterized protein n=1 Tax=Dactylosporangium maewongense TaxID=634393 RepID=A0ABN2BRF6_9ACTN
MAKTTKRQILQTIASEADLKGFQFHDDTLIFGEGPVKHALEVSYDKHGPNLLGWTVFAFDEVADPIFSRFGGVRVEIWRPDRSAEVAGIRTPTGYRYSWSSGGEAPSVSDLISDVKEYAPSAISFASGRRDLADLLLAEANIYRGDVWAFLPPGARPSRLVKAIALGRIADDSTIERKAMDLLECEGERNISWEPERPYLFREAVKDWAKRYGAASGVDLSDVIRSSRRRR